MEARIGIIGGGGWLGNAIASAAVAAGVLAPARLTLSGRSEPRGASVIAGAHWTKDNQELVERSDIVVLSVRPEQFPEVHIAAPGRLVVSVMAATPARVIAERTGATEIVRSMPNAAASLRRSFTPWFATPAVTPENKRIVQTLFDACGEGAEVSPESQLDYCTGLTGAGAALPALLAQALIGHAVAQGLPLDFARRAAKGVVAGASQLLVEEGADPEAIMQVLIDYRGMTAALLRTAIDRGFMDIVAAGLEAAVARSVEIARG